MHRDLAEKQTNIAKNADKLENFRKIGQNHTQTQVNFINLEPNSNNQYEK